MKHLGSKIQALMYGRCTEKSGDTFTKFYSDRSKAEIYIENSVLLHNQGFSVARPYSIKENVRGLFGLSYTGITMPKLDGLEINLFDGYNHLDFEYTAKELARKELDRAHSLGWNIPSFVSEQYNHIIYNPETNKVSFISLDHWKL